MIEKFLAKPMCYSSIAIKLLMVATACQVGHTKINPIDVNALIDKAVQTHPLVGAAMADERAAVEGVTAAKLNFLPTPSISTSNDSTYGTVSRVGIRQPIWTGGQLTANVNQAIYDNKAATAYVYEQQNTVAKNTIDIWQSYMYAVALQELYTQNLARLADFEAMMKRRVDQGVSARIELDLVTNRILQDQNSFQGAKEQQKIAEARLEQMIGQPVDATGQAVPLMLLVRYAKEQSANFSQLAFSNVSDNHPSVVRQRFTVEAAKQEVKAQRASRYPTFYAQYEHAYYHDDGRDENDFSWGVSYDPGAGFSNLALERASSARVQSLLQSTEATRRTTMENIQTQYQQFISARDQELSLTAAAAGAQIVVNSYQRQFIAGRKSWLEVLNAVREQSQYQQQLLQVQAQMVASFYKLQVDFGLMPWQTNHLPTEATEFRPYLLLAQWLKYQPHDAYQVQYVEPTALVVEDVPMQTDVAVDDSQQLNDDNLMVGETKEPSNNDTIDKSFGDLSVQSITDSHAKDGEVQQDNQSQRVLTEGNLVIATTRRLLATESAEQDEVVDDVTDNVITNEALADENK